MTIRSTLVLVALACGPAFCQNSSGVVPDGAGKRFSDTLAQALGGNLNLYPDKVPANANLVIPHPLTVGAMPVLVGVCSIPLLKAFAPGTPVSMPNLRPRATAPGQQSPVDHMTVVVPPAPACAASAGLKPLVLAPPPGIAR